MVELNHCWVQLTQCWVKILQFISSTYLHSLSTFPFYTPIYLPSIRYCCNGAPQLPFGFPPVTRPPTHMTSPLLTIQLYTFSLPPLYSLHPLSTSPLQILYIVGYCHGTTQLPLGCPLMTRQPRMTS